MGIDRIGKGGGLPPTPDASSPSGGVGGAGAVGSTGKTFEVDRSGAIDRARTNEASRAGSVDAAGAASPLARLRAGEIDVHGYIDLKVDQATAGLKGLSPTELADIKSALRDQMATDPGLADLVRSATGQMPKPPED